MAVRGVQVLCQQRPWEEKDAWGSQIESWCQESKHKSPQVRAQPVLNTTLKTAPRQRLWEADNEEELGRATCHHM